MAACIPFELQALPGKSEENEAMVKLLGEQVYFFIYERYYLPLTIEASFSRRSLFAPSLPTPLTVMLVVVYNPPS